jgi:DNA invertase Pin-like site-specific DNA recombinase
VRRARSAPQVCWKAVVKRPPHADADAALKMLGVFAEFERGIIRERVNAGLARARAKGAKLGRRPVRPSVEASIRELKARGMGMLKIGRTLGVGTSVVQRVVSAVA